MGQQPKNPEAPEIDWDAFGKWADAHDEILRTFKKMPRGKLEVVNAIVHFRADRSGSVCLNNFPRFISGLRAGFEVQSCPRRRASLATNDRRGGQLGAHQGLHAR